MTDEYNITVYDRDTGRPKAAVTVTALSKDGEEIVEAVRQAVEPEGETE